MNNAANSKRVAIVQSNYLPWKGYFDLIAAADEFILYDDMQFTRRDWRNRNKIKTPQGLFWLTVPVKTKGKYHQKICETEIDGGGWAEKHWGTLRQNYRKAPCFEPVAALLEPYYTRKRYVYLSDLNRDLITAICKFIGITTVITASSDYRPAEGKTERLMDLCRQAGATEYISGPSAQTYIDEDVFTKAGIALTWFDYSGYPEYPQPWGEFRHEVSIVDLLFNCGAEAKRYMKWGMGT